MKGSTPGGVLSSVETGVWSLLGFQITQHRLASFGNIY